MKIGQIRGNVALTVIIVAMLAIVGVGGGWLGYQQGHMWGFQAGFDKGYVMCLSDVANVSGLSQPLMIGRYRLLGLMSFFENFMLEQRVAGEVTAEVENTAYQPLNATVGYEIHGLSSEFRNVTVPGKSSVNETFGVWLPIGNGEYNVTVYVSYYDPLAMQNKTITTYQAVVVDSVYLVAWWAVVYSVAASCLVFFAAWMFGTGKVVSRKHRLDYARNAWN